MRSVANVLNKLKYSGELTRTKITTINRGTPENKKVIQGEEIVEIKKDRFICLSEGEETTIPNHRILEAELGKDVLWANRSADKNKYTNPQQSR